MLRTLFISDENVINFVRSTGIEEEEHRKRMGWRYLVVLKGYAMRYPSAPLFHFLLSFPRLFVKAFIAAAGSFLCWFGRIFSLERGYRLWHLAEECRKLINNLSCLSCLCEILSFTLHLFCLYLPLWSVESSFKKPYRERSRVWFAFHFPSLKSSIESQGAVIDPWRFECRVQLLSYSLTNSKVENVVVVSSCTSQWGSESVLYESCSLELANLFEVLADNHEH